MRLRAILARFALACSFLATATSTGAPDDVQRFIQLVESRYHSARTLRAVFLERYTEGRTTVRLESGTAYFSRPGRMRWEYEEPENKLFLTDGKTVWFYVPADHTVSLAPMKESSDLRTPLSLITGRSTLSRFCKRIDLLKQPVDGGPVTLRCHPREIGRAHV
jgi:chaperone LolA